MVTGSIKGHITLLDVELAKKVARCLGPCACPVSSGCGGQGAMRSVLFAGYHHFYTGTGHTQSLVAYDVRDLRREIHTRSALLPFAPRGRRLALPCSSVVTDGYKVACLGGGDVITVTDVRTWRPLFELPIQTALAGQRAGFSGQQGAQAIAFAGNRLAVAFGTPSRTTEVEILLADLSSP